MDPATVPDPVLQEAVSKMLPPAWVPYAPLVVLVLMFGGRAFIALRQNGGLVGIFKAIFLGVSPNGPQVLLAALLSLSLCSCKTFTQIEASPIGHVVVSTSKDFLTAAAHATEPALIEEAILKAEARRAAVLLQPATTLPAILTKAAEIAVWATSISMAQNRYEKLTGHRFYPDKSVRLVNP
jgi:hypothetical protein